MHISRPPIDVFDNIQLGYIASSLVHGFGLFACQNICKDDIVGVLDGQRLSWEYYHTLKAALNIDETLKNLFFFEWNVLKDENSEHTMLLVRSIQTKYSYINHSRRPNLYLDVHSHHIDIKALDDIEAHEEFLLDYRKEPLPAEYLQGHGATYL